MRYDVIVSSVHDRADLLDRTLRQMLTQLDQKPEHVIVHEDVRDGQPLVEGLTEKTLESIGGQFGVPLQLIRTSPGGGFAHAMVKLLSLAETEYVFHTQEDFDFVRPLPIRRALEIATAHRLNQIRFNKRKTMRIKGEHRVPAEWWTKTVAVLEGQPFCISDRWYQYGGLNRRDVALAGFEAITANDPGMIHHSADRFDGWFNPTMIGHQACSTDGHQEHRLELARTLIWGVVAEPPFMIHTGGGDRRSEQVPA